MKVAARFQFYFPYVLPRGQDWESNGIAVRIKSLEVKVRVRNLTEDLFPNEIDKTLSTMTAALSRLSLPTSTVTRSMRDLCCDRVECLVIGDVASLAEVQAQDLQSDYRHSAIRACNVFLDHCRVCSRSTVVSGVEVHYRVQDRKYYVITPHSTSWFEPNSGVGLPVYPGDANSVASSGAIPSPERQTASMFSIKASLARNEYPDLGIGLLLDARERLITLRLREAVISLATALEIASDQYIARSALDSKIVKEILRNRFLSFADKRFDATPNLLSNRSLKREDSPTFADVESTYRIRNGVAHTGRLFDRQGGTELPVDAARVTELLIAVERAIEWLNSF